MNIPVIKVGKKVLCLILKIILMIAISNERTICELSLLWPLIKELS